MENAAVDDGDPPPPAHEDSSVPISVEQNTAAMTVGGHGCLPHLFRRVWHISTFTTLSWFYYYIAIDICDRIGFPASKIVAILALSQMVMEGIRIRQQFLCFGFRSYERNQISAQAWGLVGAAIVLIAAPYRISFTSSQTSAQRAFIGMPILWTLAFIDPLLGELKAHGSIGKICRPGQGFTLHQRSAIGVVVTWAIWTGIGLVSGEYIWWLIVIMGPLSVAAEYPKLRFIDDNAMMELVPLAASLLLSPFFPDRS
uniref:Phosphatidate cytidylyltransferase n=1 Tax=Spongospora subterranea TaxID=70186 RepID=A0A0H5QQE5_9EUKA|eukprot:CRZ04263.1 hypothetical protein [Spongospora subterranea]